MPTRPFDLPANLRRRIALVILCLLAHPASAAPPALAVKQPLQPARPDVILITVDTLRADHVGCYGYALAKTPALDALNADGIRFTQAFTPSPITNTSHASILTGLLPSSHGVTDFGIPLAGHATLAELLKAQGYQTAAFIGAVILDSATLSPGFDRGFDFYDNFPADAPAIAKNGKPTSRFGRVERRADEVVAHAEAWLAAHPATKSSGPRFLWVHLYDPHDPYEPPEPFASQFQNHPYDGEIAYADSAIAHLLDFIKKHNDYDRSLIVVTGDHGEGLGEHKEETHGIFLYDSTLHVPLIFKVPFATGEKPPPVSHWRDPHSQVQTIDITPTILDWLNIHAETQFDGESLKQEMLTGDFLGRALLAETDYPLRFGWAPLRAVRFLDKKFIQAPRSELYDYASDAGEQHNILGAGYGLLDVLNRLRAKQVAPQPAEPNPLHAALPDPKDKIEEQNLLHRAMMAGADNRTNDARQSLEQALALDAKSPTALLQLGQLELVTDNFRKAADYLARARAIRPDDAAAALAQGRALASLGDNAAAKDALEATLTLRPGQLDARLLLGETYLKLGNAPAALDQFEAAGLLDPGSEAANNGAARAAALAKAAPPATPKR